MRTRNNANCRSSIFPKSVACMQHAAGKQNSERTEPIAPEQSARSNGNSHRTLIAPADRRDGYCLIVFFQKIGLAIVSTVQFLTHCDQI
jgi:hypothetical protein